MYDSQKTYLIERAQSVLDCLKSQNSGADIHKVGNMRNIASLLIEDIKHEKANLDFACAKRIVDNLEKELVAFYKDKYFPRH
jgi:hypothetical protein